MLLRHSSSLLSPIKEERLKEGAADFDDEEESTVEEEDDVEGAEAEDDEDLEEQLLAADALRGRMRAAAAHGRFQMLPVRGRALCLLAGVGCAFPRCVRSTRPRRCLI